MREGLKPRVQGVGSIGFPRGAWLVIGVEFWERFSFYGMLAILALFLTAPPSRGGFGWSDGRALTLVGLYSGLMYALPAFGGYIADRIVGRRRAVTIGATLMFIGQSLMATLFYVPRLLGLWHGVPVQDALNQLNVPLGYLLVPDSVNAAIAVRGVLLDHNRGVAWLSQAYASSAIGLYGAIAFLVAGNALMKSTMVVLCGETFAEHDTRRQGAYAYYYLGITAGALLSGIVVGEVADLFGWQYGFAVGAIGMAIALGAYCTLGPRWLGETGVRPERVRGAHDTLHDALAEMAGQTAHPRRMRARLLLIVILALFLCVFSAGFFQMYGSWSLFIEHSVDRTIRGFAVPVPWFVAWNSLIGIVLAPPVAALWMHLAARRRNVDIVQRYAFALATAAAGHFLMYGAATLSPPGVLAPLWVPALASALSAFGELVAWTSTYNMVYEVAPQGLVSATMGAWYLMTLGAGGFLSGAIGNWVDALGYADTFLVVGTLISVVAIAACLARGPLRRLAADIEVRL